MGTRKVLAAAAVLALLGFVVACAPSVVIRHSPAPPPSWVNKLPKRSGEVCALGHSGPTFYQPDCVKNAAENGRGHLSETISVHIRSVTVDISDGSRGSFSQDVFVQGSESVSEAVLQGSEVTARWFDRQGTRGPQNGCYVMVCIDPNKPLDHLVKQIAKQLPEKAVAKVRENAAAAFDELEKTEQQK